VNRAEASTMPGSHILVHALDSVCTAKVTVLLVHVVRAGTRVIAEPDTKVLDFEGLLFVDLENAQQGRLRSASLLRLPLEGCKGFDTHNINTNDFTTSFFDLLQLPE
jgi:hypothetical protein